MNHVQIELTNRCNFQCKFCEIKNHRIKDELPIQQVYHILDQLVTAELPGGKIFMVSLNGVGEPLLYPHLAEAVAYAKARFPFVGFITNGYLLTHELADKLLSYNIDYITVSINAVDAEVYKKFQGYRLKDPEAVLKRVLGNVTYLMEQKERMKKKTELRIPYIVTKDSKDHMEEFIQYWKNTGHEVLIQFTRLMQFKKPEHVKYTRCERLLEDFMIFSNGDVTMCACDQTRSVILGNIYEQKIEDIMNGKQYMDIVRANDRFDLKHMPKACFICDRLIDEGFLRNYSIGYKIIYVNNFWKGLKWKLYGVGIQWFTELKKHDATWPLFRKIKKMVVRNETAGRNERRLWR